MRNFAARRNVLFRVRGKSDRTIERDMNRICVRVLVGAMACAALPAGKTISAQTATATASGPDIQIEDVTRFYRVYDAAEGHPTAEQLQHDYIDPGSEGLHKFAKIRRISGAAIAETLSKHPEIYSDARRCMAVLPNVRRRLEVALHTLGRLYPDATFPPVTIAIGRGKPVGTTSADTGVLIGLEALCATDTSDPNIEDRF